MTDEELREIQLASSFKAAQQKLIKEGWVEQSTQLISQKIKVGLFVRDPAERLVLVGRDFSGELEFSVIRVEYYHIEGRKSTILIDFQTGKLTDILF